MKATVTVENCPHDIRVEVSLTFYSAASIVLEEELVIQIDENQYWCSVDDNSDIYSVYAVHPAQEYRGLGTKSFPELVPAQGWIRENAYKITQASLEATKEVSNALRFAVEMVNHKVRLIENDLNVVGNRIVKEG